MISPTHKWKWSPLWIGIAWLLVAIVTYLSLTPSPPDMPAAHADKYGHVIAYAVVMFWFMQIYGEAHSRVVIGIGLFLLGIVLEIAQAYTGYRELEAADMLANAIGIAVGWLLAPPRTVNLLERIEASI